MQKKLLLLSYCACQLKLKNKTALLQRSGNTVKKYSRYILMQFDIMEIIAAEANIIESLVATCKALVILYETL